MKISSISLMSFVVLTAIVFIYILLEYNVRKIGIEQAIFEFKVKYQIEKALLDSKIFFERRSLKTSENIMLVSLPKIKINIRKGNAIGEIMIQNSMKYQDKLERIDVSSAIKDYVQESAYLTDNREWYIFNLDLDSSDTRFIFDSIEDIQEKIQETNKQAIFIDEKFPEIPYFHILLSGQTGSGKTYAMYSLILQLQMQNVSLTIVDPKSSNLAVFGELLGVKTATETQDIIVVLRKVVSKMNQRKKDVMCSVRNSNNIDTTALDFDYQPEFILIDEFAALQLRLDRNQQKELDSLIGQILLEGRSLGYYLILAMQQANAKLISTNLREQFQVQVVLGNSGEQTFNTVFGAHLASLIPKRNMRVGEGWAMISGKTTTPRLVRFPFLNFEISKELKKI